MDFVNRSTPVNTPLCLRQRKSKGVSLDFFFLFYLFFLLFFCLLVLFSFSFCAPLVTNNTISCHWPCVICYSAPATFWNPNLDHWVRQKQKTIAALQWSGGLAGKSGLTRYHSHKKCTCNMSGHLGVSASALQTLCTSTSSQMKRKKREKNNKIMEKKQALSKRIEPHAVHHSH